VVHDKLCNQNELLKLVRTTLLSAAESLPKVRVAYNATYGGYGYTQLFQDYIKSLPVEAFPDRDDDYTNGHRVQVVPLFSSFGKQVATMYPSLARMMSLYCQHDLATVFSNIASRSTELDKAITFLEGKIATLTQALSHLPPATLDAMIKSYKHMYPEEREALKQPYYMRQDYRQKKDEKCKMSFAEAVEYYTPGPMPWAMWKCDEHVNERVMRFLQEHSDLLEPKEPNEDDDTKVCELLGLIFASDAYSRLEITEVPQILDWQIHEYDGSESVTIV